MSETETKVLRLDFGCGPNPKPGFEGVDILPFDGKVTHVFDVRSGKWPFEDNSVDEASASHFLEHLTNLNDKWERVHFFNELHRILKPKAGCMITIPHWTSQRFYGDPTHKEPCSEFGLLYLSEAWRALNAPHADAKYVPHGYACDFDFMTNGYGLHPGIQPRHIEAQQFACTFYRDAITDWTFTVIKRG